MIFHAGHAMQKTQILCISRESKATVLVTLF